MSFIQKVQSSLGELVYLVRGEDGGKSAWHFVLIDKMKLPLFKQALSTGTVDVSHYGKVIHSGWGKEPPQELIDQVKKQYS